MRANNRQLYWCSLCAAVILFSIGFTLAKLWWCEALIFFVIPILWAENKYHFPSIYMLFLIALTSSGVLGVLLGASPPLMIAGVAFSIMSWELGYRNNHSKIAYGQPQVRNFENNRNKFVCVSTGVGLLAAEMGLLLKMNISFGAVFIIAAVVLFSLFKLFQLFKGLSAER